MSLAMALSHRSVPPTHARSINPVALGFTLVELLVVIGIIAVLISILLPTLGQVRGQARSVQCMANLRTIGQGLYFYADKSKGSLPYGFWDGFVPAERVQSGRASNGDLAGSWPMLILNTFNGRLGTSWNSAFNSGTNTTKLREALFCPELGSVTVDQNASSTTHYLSHPRIMPAMDGQFPDPQNPTATYRPYKLAKIKRSTEIILIFDGSLSPVGSSDSYYRARFQVPVANALDTYRFSRIGGDSTALTDQYNLTSASFMQPNAPIDLTPQPGPASFFNTDTDQNASNIRFRHMKNRQANTLFADGHVGSFKIKTATQSDLLRKNINVNP